MSDFLTRVELYDAKWPDEYISRLHSAMAREGFSKTITDEKGIVYELPVADSGRDAELGNGQDVYAVAASSAWCERCW